MWSILNIRKHSPWRRWWLPAGMVILLAAGCATQPSGPSVDSAGINADPPSRAPIASKDNTSPKNRDTENRLRSAVRKWKGTPHRMGGTTRRGIDCSGFVQRLYADLYNHMIPRSTYLQVKSGKHIGKKELRAGDLVFFRLPRKGRHVGIYLSGTEFAHASTSKGVTVSSIEDPYWRGKYWTARRYLNAPH